MYLLQQPDTTTMPDEFRQNVAVNDRIERFIEVIGQHLEKQAARMPPGQRTVFRSSLRHGKKFSISTIAAHAVAVWADEIKHGKQVAWDDLKRWLREYLNLIYLETSRITQVRFDDETADALNAISAYLFAYPQDIPLLKSRRYENVASGRIVTILALAKLAYEINPKLPPLD